MEIEQIRQVLEGAPEGATHFSECINSNGVVQEYLKHDSNPEIAKSWSVYWSEGSNEVWMDADELEMAEFNHIHSLDDLRTILSKHEEVVV